jgi:hypothetical protein
LNTPDKVAKEMLFLKNSWANLAEQDDDADIDMDETATSDRAEFNSSSQLNQIDKIATEEEPFQTVTGKRNRKKSKAAQKKGYITRATASHASGES